jgi:hypothetical protein
MALRREGWRPAAVRLILGRVVFIGSFIRRLDCAYSPPSPEIATVRP